MDKNTFMGAGNPTERFQSPGEAKNLRVASLKVVRGKVSLYPHHPSPKGAHSRPRETFMAHNFSERESKRDMRA